MKQVTKIIVLLVCVFSAASAQNTFSSDDSVRLEFINKLYVDALERGNTYQLLEHLCKNYPRRISGSAIVEKAVNWTKQVMENYKFDKVFLQECMVPHWVRGAKEQAAIVSANGDKTELTVTALGMSVATPPEGITAPVLMVNDIGDLKKLDEDAARGKIVFYNAAFPQHFITTGPAYEEGVQKRAHGPVEAAGYGAVAVVIRSVTSAFDDAPHTGSTHYDDNVKKIPAAALGYQSSDKLVQVLKENPGTQLFLKINSQTLPDVKSHNVVGELTGSEYPDQIIVFGGHLDAWDVGEGAHDDGAGAMHCLNALHELQLLGYKPKHTLRVVMFMNEENGSRGGKKYAELAIRNGEKHIIALESDIGGFSPRGFGFTGPDSSLEKIRGWLKFFPDFTIDRISKGGGGEDISALHKADNTPIVGFIPDIQRYFDYHHSDNDTFDKINRRELELGTASIAAFIYLVDQYGL